LSSAGVLATCACIGCIAPVLAPIADWRATALEQAVRGFAEANRLKLGEVAQPLRAAITGSLVSPPIFEVLAVLGQAETMGRLSDQGGGN